MSDSVHSVVLAKIVVTAGGGRSAGDLTRLNFPVRMIRVQLNSNNVIQELVMNISQHSQVIQELDRLISEMSTLRMQISRLDLPSLPRSIRNTECFGMWADREDLPASASSREWLEQWRKQQWQRS
jgi:hypothetical protein